jgi:hypothetical protein
MYVRARARILAVTRLECSLDCTHIVTVHFSRRHSFVPADRRRRRRWRPHLHIYAAALALRAAASAPLSLARGRRLLRGAALPARTHPLHEQRHPSSARELASSRRHERRRRLGIRRECHRPRGRRSACQHCACGCRRHGCRHGREARRRFTRHPPAAAARDASSPPRAPAASLARAPGMEHQHGAATEQ